MSDAPKFKTFRDLRSLPVNQNKPPLEIVPPVEIVPPTNLPARQPTDLPTNAPADLPTKQPVAPEKDFARIPNSIKRAVEAGSFPNSSLAIYLYLYSLTRGAITPKRTVRINKAKLLFGSNLRSEKALLKNLAHLKTVGLLKITIYNGDHSGNEYEVFVPEEVGETPTNLPTRQPTYLPSKHTPLPTVQTSAGRYVEDVENTDTYDALRLSFKDKRENDDELARLVSAKLFEAHGRHLSEKERGQAFEIFEIIADEIGAAFSNSSNISNAVSFAAEHLRRKFAKPNLASKFAGVKKDNVGESKFDRASALKDWRDYLSDGGTIAGLETYRANYEADDWTWLMENVSK